MKSFEYPPAASRFSIHHQMIIYLFRLKIDQSRLKHGSEVISGASGGSIPSTHEPDLIPTSKEVVRCAVNETEFDNEQGSDLDTDIITSSEYREDRMPQDTFFACDIYTESSIMKKNCKFIEA